MPETFENWFSLVNRCIYHAHQTCEIYQVLPYSMDFKAPWELWNPLSNTVRNKCSLFGLKALKTSEMTIKLKSNLYAEPGSIFPIPNTDTCLWFGISV